MKLSERVNDFVRPRWSRWLRELCVTGFTPDVLRTAPGDRDSAPRGAVAAWLAGKRTITTEGAYFVGQRIAADPRLAPHGDPILSLYAAGYCSVAAACLQLTIDRALASYPNKSKVARVGVIDARPAPVRDLNYALIAAVAVPYALAHIDGVSDNNIAPSTRAAYLAEVTSRSEPRIFDGRQTYASQSGAYPTGTADASLTVADRETLAWTSFVNRLSLRAQHDRVLQLHFSMLREQVDAYQRIVYAVPHHKPQP